MHEDADALGLRPTSGHARPIISIIYEAAINTLIKDLAYQGTGGDVLCRGQILSTANCQTSLSRYAGRRACRF